MSAERLISIIVCIYNARDYLKQCIDSIIGQTYTNLEILLIDDGSTDGSSEICDYYGGIDERVVVYHQQNRGLVEARKVGVSIAKGDYIGFVDADDWIEEGMYEGLYAGISQNDAQIVCSGRYEEYDDRTVRCPNQKPAGVYRGIDKEKLIDGLLCTGRGAEFLIYPTHWDKLFEKSLLYHNQMQVPPEVEHGEDVACTCPCLLEAETVVLLDEIWYHYRQRSESMVHCPKADYFDRQAIQINYLRKRLKDLPFQEEMLKQLDWYAYFVMLYGMRKLLDFSYLPPSPPPAPVKQVSEATKWLFPYECVPKGSRVVLYGFGKVGSEFFSEIVHNHYCELIAIVDQDFTDKQNAVCEIPFIRPERLSDYHFDFIVLSVASEEKAGEMRDIVEKLGIKQTIIWNDYRYRKVGVQNG